MLAGVAELVESMEIAGASARSSEGGTSMDLPASCGRFSKRVRCRCIFGRLARQHPVATGKPRAAAGTGRVAAMVTGLTER